MALGPGVVEQVGGEQQQGRTDALAASFAQVLGNFGNGADAGGGVAAQLLLDGYEVFSQQLENLSCGRYGQGAQSCRFSRFLFLDRLGLGGTDSRKPARRSLNSCGSS